jgi:hypothetical protein
MFLVCVSRFFFLAYWLRDDFCRRWTLDYWVYGILSSRLRLPATFWCFVCYAQGSIEHLACAWKFICCAHMHSAIVLYSAADAFFSCVFLNGLSIPHAKANTCNQKAQLMVLKFLPNNYYCTLHAGVHADGSGVMLLKLILLLCITMFFLCWWIVVVELVLTWLFWQSNCAWNSLVITCELQEQEDRMISQGQGGRACLSPFHWWIMWSLLLFSLNGVYTSE